MRAAVVSDPTGPQGVQRRTVGVQVRRIQDPIAEARHRELHVRSVGVAHFSPGGSSRKARLILQPLTAEDSRPRRTCIPGKKPRRLFHRAVQIVKSRRVQEQSWGKRWNGNGDGRHGSRPFVRSESSNSLTAQCHVPLEEERTSTVVSRPPLRNPPDHNHRSRTRR